MTRKKVTLRTLAALKAAGTPAAAITCYDYPSAVFADRAEMDWILIGDSGGMCQLGYTNTMPVTMADMLHFTRAVCRAKPMAFVVGDMPFGSYQTSDYDAVCNAVEFMRAGCDAVKLEGGERVCSRIKAIVDAGIPVMGHLGLTPQAMSQQGGYRVTGRTELERDVLGIQTSLVYHAGAFAVLLEAMPEETAGKVACWEPSDEEPDDRGPIVYGIGAGAKLDGQLLIWHDVMGMFCSDAIKMPKFAKQYLDGAVKMELALHQYRCEVQQGRFPADCHKYPMQKEGAA